MWPQLIMPISCILFPPNILPTLWWCPGPGRPQDLPILCESWDCGGFPSLLGHINPNQNQMENLHLGPRESWGGCDLSKNCSNKNPSLPPLASPLVDCF